MGDWPPMGNLCFAVSDGGSAFDWLLGRNKARGILLYYECKNRWKMGCLTMDSVKGLGRCNPWRKEILLCP